MNPDTAGFEKTRETDTPELTLSAGGFTADTAILTTGGPTPVADLTTDHVVYTLDLTTRLLKTNPVVSINRVPSEDEVITIKTRRADLRIAPDHRLPYCTKAIDRPRVQRAGILTERAGYQFINEWRRPNRAPVEAVDITELLSEYEACAVTDKHGHTFRAALPDGCEPCRVNQGTGYHFDPTTFKAYQEEIETIADEVTIQAAPGHHRRPYRFDGDDFVELLGWFITEGSVDWSSDRETGEVKIAQETDAHRQRIAALFDRMGLDARCSDRGIRIGSFLLGQLLECLCGNRSRQKHLPEFIWSLCQEQQQHLLNVLLWGDGNDRGTYYTASPDLTADVCRLCLELGMKPRYTVRDDIWQLYVREVNDGFRSAQHVSRVEHEDELYQLTVADYSTVMAGRNGKFQWVGVSGVA